MPYNKGFRLFNLKWVVSSVSTPGSSYENNDPTSGKILNSNNTFGYTDDTYGVKRCIEDFCAPLFAQESNGEGWQLDTSLCPNNQAILLQPNNRVWALFFRHTTGARLMLGLGYFGMVSAAGQPSVDPPVYTGSGNKWRDVGFLAKKTNYLYPLSDPNMDAGSPTTVVGSGLFISMVPPSNSGDPQDVFHPEASIRDLAFYPQTMTPVMYQFMDGRNIVVARDGNMIGCSFIKQGTDDTNSDYGSSNTRAMNNGVIVGKSVKLSLIVCEEVVGFLGWYNSSIWMGGNIVGRILSECRNPNDTLSTAEYGELAFSSGNPSSSSSSVTYIWNSGNKNYYNINRCCNVTGTDWPNMYIGFDRNGYVDTPINFEYIYSGYAYGWCPSNPVSTNGQEKAKLRADLFRFTADSTNKTFSQVYNDGEWCCFRYSCQSDDYKNNLISIDNDEHSSVLIIKWDGAFNGVQNMAG